MLRKYLLIANTMSENQLEDAFPSLPIYRDQLSPGVPPCSLAEEIFLYKNVFVESLKTE